MKSGDLVKLFGVSHKTIHNWVNEFKMFLSDGAKKLDSRQSIFDGNDLIVMATIAELSQKEKLPYSIIHEKLEAGYRVEDVQASAVGYEDGRVVPATVVEQIIDASQLRVELEHIRYERDRLLQIVENHHELEKELRGEIKTLQEKIAQLQHDLGLAQGELNIRRQIEERKDENEDRDKRRRWFGND